MSRFKKSTAVEQIMARADAHQKIHGFDLNNGTSQLLPKNADEKLQALVARAVAYGQIRALQGVAEDIDSGHLGVEK